MLKCADNRELAIHYRLNRTNYSQNEGSAVPGMEFSVWPWLG